MIAYNLVTRTNPYGTYQYHRFTHRVELKERLIIKTGPRKGFQYFAKKRKYCYLPVGDLQVTKGPRAVPRAKAETDNRRQKST